MSRNYPWLAAALVLGIGACSGGSTTQKPDTGVNDAPTQDVVDDTPTGTDTPEDMAPAMDANDGGVEDAAPTTDATDGPTVDCAPLPTGTSPAGTAPMQDAGPTVATTATRPELAQNVVDQYTVQKVLAQGFNINGGVVPDGGVGPVTYDRNDNWDPQTNGIGDPATFTPMFTVAADGSGTHTNFNTVFTEANALMVCGRVYIRVMPGTYRGAVIVPSKASAPGITVYSTDPDASKTVIINNAGTSVAGSMTLSSTIRILAVRGFQMKNMTVAND